MFRPEPPSWPCSGCTRATGERKCRSKSLSRTSLDVVSIEHQDTIERGKQVAWTGTHPSPGGDPAGRRSATTRVALRGLTKTHLGAEDRLRWKKASVSMASRRRASGVRKVWASSTFTQSRKVHEV